MAVTTLDNQILNVPLSREIIDEVHSLLWIKPHLNRGEYDLGWSCRDHALIIAGILLACGSCVALEWGRVMFVEGPEGGHPPCGIGQEGTISGHMWLRIEGVGMFDVSPRLSGIRDLPWREVPFDAIVSDRWYPDNLGDVITCTNIKEFQNHIAVATHIEGAVRAIYLIEGCKALDANMFVNAMDTVNSPLTDMLRSSYGHEIYSKAVLHFVDRINGRGRSLRGVSRNKAWSIISSRAGDAITEVLRVTKLS